MPHETPNPAPWCSDISEVQDVLAACRSLGFALAGIAPAAPSTRAAQFSDWLSAGKHGTMHWLEESAPLRLDPDRLLSGARSFIVVADRYAPKHDASGDDQAPAPGNTPEPTGRIARYAHGLDYHAVMKRRLHTLADALRARHPTHEFRAFVDSAPVLEREHAVRAGLGFIGKHTLLINPVLGSYVLLGGLLSTLQLEPLHHPLDSRTDNAIDNVVEPTSRCGSCTRCIDACPTDAITPYSVDARRCISYLTIEHEGENEPSLNPHIGDWTFGCDICQEVCPFNQRRTHVPTSVSEPPIHPGYTPTRNALPLLDALQWNEADRTRELSGSALKRLSLDMLHRNVRVALANHKVLASKSDAPGST